MRRSGHHILLAVPTRGCVNWQTVTRLEEARDQTPGLRPIFYQPGNLSVALTRNRIVRQFLATYCTTLIMVDDDVVPPPTFVEILDRPLGEFACVAIPHPMPHPQDPSRLILTAYSQGDNDLIPHDLEDGLNEVDAVATGCFAVSREALERLGHAPFLIADDPDAPVKSDDFLFCADLKTAGFRIAAWWDGWCADHVSQVNLGALWERQNAGERSVR